MCSLFLVLSQLQFMPKQEYRLSRKRYKYHCLTILEVPVEAFYKAVVSGDLTVSQAVAAMRKISRLTQPEFAAHRGISVQALRQIENGTGNPTLGP